MRRRRIIIWFLVILLALLLLPFAFLTFEHFRGKIGLARYKKELRAKGVKLTPQELEALRPTGENGAPALLAAINQVNSNVALFTNSPLSMRLLPSGRAIVGFRESEWSEEGATRLERVTNNWDKVAADLETSVATLRLIRELLKKPVLDNHIDLSQFPTYRLGHLAKAKSLASYLGGAMQAALQDGRHDDAVENLIAEIQIARWLEEDRNPISEIMEFALVSRSLSYTWEMLQAEGLSERELARIQEAWERAGSVRAMNQGLAGALVHGEVRADHMRGSNAAASDSIEAAWRFGGSADEESWWERALSNLPGGERLMELVQRQVYCRIWRFAWLDQNELRAMQRMDALMEISERAAREKSLASVQPAIDKLCAEHESRNFYDSLRFPLLDMVESMERYIPKGMAAESARSLALSGVAIKRYTLKYGKLPTSVEALVPEFLAVVPTDYMDGKPIKYRLNSDGSFALYSVGEDAKDDGGDGALPAKNDESVASRKRKDYLWPMPATPAELEAYRRSELAK